MKREKDVNRALNPVGKKNIFPSNISIIIRITPIAIQTFGKNKNKSKLST